ncbi:MAG: DUF2711 family protein [Bacteroidota bacterium]
MIYTTPLLSPEILDLVKNDDVVLIMEDNFPCCFVAFNSFLQAKEDYIIPEDRFPSDSEIVDHFTTLSWDEVLKITGLEDIKSLDRSLAFFHTERRIADRDEYNKLKTFLEENEDKIIPAFVDDICPITLVKIFLYFSQIGQDEVFVSSFLDDERKKYKITEIIKEINLVPSEPRIESLDLNLKIVQDFDQRFFCIHGNLQQVTEMVNSLLLEGFYADKNTPFCWSWDEKKIINEINWDEL